MRHRTDRWAAGLVLLAGPIAVAQTPTLPAAIAAYYGWPSLINGSGNVAAAAAVFAAYDRVVLGDGLQDPAHPDHNNTLAIAAAIPGTRFYGYVSIGVTTAGWSLAQVQARLAAWAAMGVRGVLLDEAGFEYGVTRTRLNSCIDMVHGLQLEAFVNAWLPAEVFDAAVTPLNPVGGGNPTGLPTHLGSSDRYLIESFLIENGSYQPTAFALARADAAAAYRQQFGTRIDTITTTLATTPFDQAQSDFAWWCAVLYGFDGYGIGEPVYAAATASMPARLRPTPGSLGSQWQSDVVHAPTLDRHQRQTDTGLVRVDTAQHRAAFWRATITGPGSAAIGATTQWTIQAPDFATAPYLAVATLATSPGIPLADGRLVPAADDFLLRLSLVPDPLFSGFRGGLDGNGAAAIGIAVPPLLTLRGISFHLLFAPYDFADPAVLPVFSTPHTVTLQ